ncbi:response regulator [Pigmentiphaga litoralis]|uniref:response regulator n=1 Tax=Pigmentiphaga litoralis TaxID=516702 RepID=UPI003B430316
MQQDLFNILVVDDEPLNLAIISEHLSDPRYRLKAASDGIQAWDMLQHGGVPFDIVVLDRMMPGINGIELLERMKSDPRFADIPVIMQTAASRQHEVLEGFTKGAHYYLTKPYEHAILVAVVSAAIDVRARQKQLKRQLTDAQEIFSNVQRAQFTFSTLSEARQLASFLAKLCPNPEAVVVGLAELMINAIEHGNLELGYAEKGRLSVEGGWAQEIERRLAMPKYAHRIAQATFRRLPDRLVFHILDEGPGFDWPSFLEMSPDRAFDSHGRGIAMANMLAFDNLSYLRDGREAVCTVLHSDTTGAALDQAGGGKYYTSRMGE